MVQETGVALYSGVVRFYSLADVRKYLKDLLDSYQREFDRSSNIIASLLRTEDQKRMEIIMSKGWTKAGAIFVNITDPDRGWLEAVFQHVNDMKPRVARTEEVLKTFESVEGLPISDNVSFLLYLRGGVPERIVVDSSKARPEKIDFKDQFETV